MQPMATFDPEKPCRVHDRLKDRTIEWRTGWAAAYKRNAMGANDGIVWFDGLILDGWTTA
jgi:hypothetical protein